MSSQPSARVLLVSSLALWLAPRLVHAQPEAEAPADEADEDGEDPAVQEAKELFAEGAGKFETADYEGAIELWTKAYGIVPNKPEYASIKAKLIANIASARERAYAIDEEVTHLNQAKFLLERYRDEIDDIYTSSIEREKEQAWVADRLGKIEVQLQEIADREAAARERDKPPARGLPPGQGLIIGGAVATGLGAAGLGLMVGGLLMGSGANDISDIPTDDLDARQTRFDRGRLGNTLAILGAAAGAALVGTGVALLVVGVKKKKKAGAEKASASLVPVLGPATVGAVLTARF